LPIRAGNCITIEPGVYIPNGLLPKHFTGEDRWPSHFHTMGIRIEDSVVVGKGKGQEVVLSVDAVKEIVDIEALIE